VSFKISLGSVVRLSESGDAGDQITISVYGMSGESVLRDEIVKVVGGRPVLGLQKVEFRLYPDRLGDVKAVIRVRGRGSKTKSTRTIEFEVTK
jgi:hypothetical protein